MAIAEQLYSWVDIRVSDFQPTIMSRLMVEDERTTLYEDGLVW